MQRGRVSLLPGDVGIHPKEHAVINRHVLRMGHHVLRLKLHIQPCQQLKHGLISGFHSHFLSMMTDTDMDRTANQDGGLPFGGVGIIVLQGKSRFRQDLLRIGGKGSNADHPVSIGDHIGFGEHRLGQGHHQEHHGQHQAKQPQQQIVLKFSSHRYSLLIFA